MKYIKKTAGVKVSKERIVAFIPTEDFKTLKKEALKKDISMSAIINSKLKIN